MAATAHLFPPLTPSRRVYTPGVFPTAEFEGLNGAVTTLQYGARAVDSKLEMTFQNITDDEAWLIFQNYERVNSGLDRDTGERDYIYFRNLKTMDGIRNVPLREQIEEGLTPGLRYRYAKPPTITSVFPGRSTVSIELRGYLDGADSL